MSAKARVEDSQQPLSVVDRVRLRHGRETWLPVGVVVLALGVAIVLPRFRETSVTHLRQEIEEAAIPARQRISDIQLQLAVAAAQRRGYLLSGDRAVIDHVAASLATRHKAEGDLIASLQRLDESGSLRGAAERLIVLTAQFDSVIIADTIRPVSAERMRAQRLRFLEIQAAAAGIASRIENEVARRRTAIARTEDLVELLTGLTLVLGFGSVLFVARMGNRFRAMALMLEESERGALHLAQHERAARAAAEDHQRELERVTESRQRLLRGFTHDVKNPLGSADGYLALIEEGIYGEVPGPASGVIAKVRKSITQALELVGRLLDIARAEAGQLELRRSQVDVGELAGEVVGDFEAQARAKQISLVAELPRETVVVFSDPTRVRQVIGNLVSNAVKYTGAGGRVVVTAALEADDALNGRQHVCIRVADNGPGIAADRLPMLFREFTRFEPQVADGAGVGLAISQKIAEALGGRIVVETQVGQGSTFMLDLPLGDRRAGSSPIRRRTPAPAELSG
ncbi:MAG TPA: HAMP domain-containing sensor histidine kinase [Gemmatimonadaceae bacterium]|nr:HAMP domain-containing sensor histidine kinase [Gemmatimonadaceae bacterium]